MVIGIVSGYLIGIFDSLRILCYVFVFILSNYVFLIVANIVIWNKFCEKK